ncbi:extracellular protease-like [Oculina patagonica]
MPPFWWIFLIMGMSNGDAHEFDVSENKVFSASLECSPRYRTTDKIECQFNLKNDGQRDFSVLKWRTPLVQLTSDCLSVTRNGKEIPYDGISIKRSTPGPDQFVLVVVGQTVSSTFEVSEGYDMSKAGTYSVAVDTNIEYAVGSVKGMNEPGKPGIDIKISHLSSPAVSFQVVGRKAGNGTSGQRARSLERGNKRILSVGNFLKRRGAYSLGPVVVGNAAQIEETKEIHRATYNKVASVYFDLVSSSNPLGNHLITWFGGSTYKQDVIWTYQHVWYYLQVDTIKYVFNGDRCRGGMYAYTYKGTRTVYLCSVYENASKYSGFDNKLGILVHELSHAIAYTDDIGYGVSFCKQLAQSNPSSAAKNADNYEYFIESLL